MADITSESGCGWIYAVRAGPDVKLGLAAIFTMALSLSDLGVIYLQVFEPFPYHFILLNFQ